MDSGSRSDSPSEIDFSVIRTAIDMGHKTIDQILNGIHYGSEEVRGLLRQECDFIFECKVCRSMFRSFPNFVAHKRVYCQELAEEKARREKEAVTTVEEETVIVQPEECHTEGSVTDTNGKQADVIDKVINRTFEGKSKEYQFYTNVAEKVEMKKATKVTNVVTLKRIEGTSKAVEVGRGKLSDIELIGKTSSPKKNSPKSSVNSTKAKSISPKGTSPKKKKNLSDVCAGLVEKRSNETVVTSALSFDSEGKRAKSLRSRKSSPRKSVDSFIGFQEKTNSATLSSKGNAESKEAEQMDVSENEMIQEISDNDDPMDNSWADFDNLRCNKCKQRFHSICHLKVHGKKVHGASYAEYKCPTCDKSFLYITSLVRHMRRTHNAPESRVLALKDKLERLHAQERKLREKQKSINSSSSQDESPDNIFGKGQPNDIWKKCDICFKKFQYVKRFNRHVQLCREMKEKQSPKKKDLTEQKDSDGGKKEKDVSISGVLSRQSGKTPNNEDMLMKLQERLLAPVLPMTTKDGGKEKTMPSSGEKGKMKTAANKSSYGTRHAASEQLPNKPIVNEDAKSALYKALTQNLDTIENTTKSNKVPGTVQKETIVYVYPPSKSKVPSSNQEANKYVTLEKDCSSPIEMTKQSGTGQGVVVDVKKTITESAIEQAQVMNDTQVDTKKQPTQTKKALTGLASPSSERKGKQTEHKEANQLENTGSTVQGTSHSEKISDSPVRDNVSRSSSTSRNSVERNTNSAKVEVVKTYETRHSAKNEAKNLEKPTTSYDKLSREIAFKELEERLTAEATGAITSPEKEPDNSKGKNVEKIKATVSKDGEKNVAGKTTKTSIDHQPTPSPMYSSSYTSPARMERLSYYSSYPGSPMSVHSNSGDAYNSKFKMTVKEMAELVEGTSLTKFARERKKKASKILNQKSEKERSGIVKKPLKRNVVARKVYSTRLSTGSKTDTNEQSIESKEANETGIASAKRDDNEDESVKQNPEQLSIRKSRRERENLASENNSSGKKVKSTDELDKSKVDEQSHDAKASCEGKISENESSSRASRTRFRERRGDSRSSSSHSEVGHIEGRTNQIGSSNSFSDDNITEKLVENKRLFREMARLESSTGFLQSKRYANTSIDVVEDKVDEKLKRDRDSSVSSRDSSREKRSEIGKQERTCKGKSGPESGSSDDKMDTSVEEYMTYTIKESLKGKETDKLENVRMSREQKRLSNSTGFVQSKHFSDACSSRESSGERSRSLKRSADVVKTDKMHKPSDGKIMPVTVIEENATTGAKRNAAKPEKSTENTTEEFHRNVSKETKSNKPELDSSTKAEKLTGKATEKSQNISIDNEKPAEQSVETGKKQESEDIAQTVKDDTAGRNTGTDDQDIKLSSVSQVAVSLGKLENSNKNTEIASDNHPHRTRLATGSIYFDSELLKTSPSKFDKDDTLKQPDNSEKIRNENQKALLGVKKRLSLSVGERKLSSPIEKNRQRTSSGPQRFSLETGVKQCQKCSKKFWKNKSYRFHIKSCARKVMEHPKKISASTQATEKMNRRSGENKDKKSSSKSSNGNKTIEDGKLKRSPAVAKVSESKKRPIDSDSGTVKADTKKPRLSGNDSRNENSKIISDSNIESERQLSNSGDGFNSESRKSLSQDKQDSVKSTDLKEDNVPLEMDKNRKVEPAKNEITSRINEEVTNVEMKENADEDIAIMDTKCVIEPQPSTSKEMGDESCSEFSGFSEGDVNDLADLDSFISDFSDVEEMEDSVDDEKAFTEDDSQKSDDRSNDNLAKLDNLKAKTETQAEGEDTPVEKTKNVKNRVYVVDCKNPSKLHCYNNSNVDKLIDEKNMKCRQCDTPCTSISNLRRHVIRHLGWKRYKCQLCAFTCYDMSECRMHLNRSHGEKLTSRNFPKLVCDLQKEATKKRSLKRMNTLRSKKALAKEEPKDTYRKPRHSMIGKTIDVATGDSKTHCKDSADALGEAVHESQMFQGKHVYAQAGKSHGKVVEVSEDSPRKKSEMLRSSSESEKEHKSDSGIGESAGVNANSKGKNADNQLNKARLTLAKALNK